MKVTCQAFMALMVWAIGQYDKSDDHFRKTHLEIALKNAKLLQDYVYLNEEYLVAKEVFKKEGDKKTPLLAAHRRFKMARKNLLQFLSEHE